MSSWFQRQAVKAVSGAITIYIGYRWYLKSTGIANDDIILTINESEYSHEFIPKISLIQVKQLIVNKFGILYKIFKIQYLSSGCDFDAFSIDLCDKNNINIKSKYLLRIARYHSTKRGNKILNKLKFEIKFLPKLQQYLNDNNVTIKIPNYIQSFSNLNNSHKSYIYGCYPLINGNKLASFDNHKICEILIKNQNNLTKFLSVLHSYPYPHNHYNMNNLEYKSSSKSFLNQIEDLEWVYNQVKDKLNDSKWITFAIFIKNDVIDVCRNILLPKWKNNDNKFLYGLVHWDMHLNHIIIDNQNIIGVIDWSDVCFGDIAFQFRCIWSLKCFKQIFDKYKEYIINEKHKNKLNILSFSVEIYGFMSLIFAICWNKLYSVSDEDELHIQKQMNKYHDEIENWKTNIKNVDKTFA